MVHTHIGCFWLVFFFNSCLVFFCVLGGGGGGGETSSLEMSLCDTLSLRTGNERSWTSLLRTPSSGSTTSGSTGKLSRTRAKPSQGSSEEGKRRKEQKSPPHDIVFSACVFFLRRNRKFLFQNCQKFHMSGREV
jgi:hypothetical protein